MHFARPIDFKAAAARGQGLRARLNATAPVLEHLLAGGYAAMLLAFFVIRDHDLLRHWSYVMVAAPFLLIAGREEWRLLARSPVIVASAAYLAWLWSSVWWSPAGSAADAFLMARDALVILAFLGSTVLLARRRHMYFPNLLRTLCWVAGVAAVLSLAWYYVVGSPNDRAWGIGIGGYPTRAGMLYGTAALVALYAGLGAATTRAESLAFTAVLTATLAFLVFAEARGAMIGFAAAGFLGALLMRQKIIMLGVPLVIGAYLVAHFSGATDAYDLISRGMTQRTMIWDLALERSVAAPWLGYGIGDPQDFLLWDGKLLIIHPHNILLSHQLAGGLVAVTLFAILLSLWFAAALRLFRREGDYVLLALLVFVVVVGLVDLELFLGPLDIEWLYFWLPIGLAAAWSAPTAPPGAARPAERAPRLERP